MPKLRRIPFSAKIAPETLGAIKNIAETYNLSESQVVDCAVRDLLAKLKRKPLLSHAVELLTSPAD